MKKSVVALLIILAMVVLISPGIIGRLAEKSVDDNLSRAAADRDDIVVTSTGFDRGWFTSAGQHRVELREGDLHDMLFGAFAMAETDALPVLIIDTRLDHGLIPVSSMARDHGSLLPGLGSAVSTLSIEFADSSVVDLPGTIFSNVGLTGALRSNFVLEPDGVDAAGVRLAWGPADFVITTNPANGDIGVRGELGSFAVASDGEVVIIDTLHISVDQAATPFGFTIGSAKITLKSFAIISATDTTTIGPIFMDSDSAIDDGRLSADVMFRMENTPVPNFGPANIEIVARLKNVDAAALGHLRRSLEAMSAAEIADTAIIDVEGDLQRLLASGLEWHFDQLDVELPLGRVTSRISAIVSESDARDFTWASALLSLDASADIRLPVDVVNMLTEAYPDMHAIIAMGFLRRKGEYYTIQATFEKGLLTVNGAPMPFPMPGLQ